MNQQPAGINYRVSEEPSFDLLSCVDVYDVTQIEKNIAFSILPTDALFPTTALSAFNNNKSGVVNTPESDTLNTPSPRSSPSPYFAIPACPPTDTTPNLNCTIPADHNENLAITSKVTYNTTSASPISQDFKTITLHSSGSLYHNTTPVPINRATYLDPATIPYLDTPQHGKITTTPAAVQISIAKKESSSTVTDEQDIPTPVAEYTTLHNSPLPSTVATSKPANYAANLAKLVSRHNPLLSKQSTLSEETCETLNLPVVYYSNSMEYPQQNVILMENDDDYLNSQIIIIDPENDTQKSCPLEAILQTCEIPTMIFGENESHVMNENYQEIGLMETDKEEEDNKESVQPFIRQETVKRNGRGRPVKTEKGKVAPKVDRRKAKLMDSEIVNAQRKQRKIDLNRIASKKYREEKKRKLAEQFSEIPALGRKNEQLKNEASKMEMEIVRYRKWLKMRNIAVVRPSIF